ncbi:putative peptidyl-tRNA hydrolase 2 [Babylonia areolata]|uniref:putative peptidyl-tRNA hydrolase 2 n=1 Tax=Babylonia areolata TaxID=304850 RepID=UPI003FCF7519
MESQSGGNGGPPLFTPNEDLVTTLMSLGFTRNAVIKALFYTGNQNADMAASWLFENQDTQDLDTPLEHELQGTSDSSEDELLEAGDLYKMVLVVNGELPMGVGKVAAQVAHATLNLYRLMVDNPATFSPMLLAWEQYGETKIVLRGETAMQLQQLADKAKSVGLPYYLVQDAGHTQVAPGSITVLGIMGKIDVVDQVTGSLKLLS